MPIHFGMTAFLLNQYKFRGPDRFLFWSVRKYILLSDRSNPKGLEFIRIAKIQC